MRALLPCHVLLTCTTLLTHAIYSQTPRTPTVPLFDASAQMSILIDQARREPLEAEQQAKAQEQLQRYFFTKKAEKFVDLWGEFTTKLQSGTFDAKLARKLSKAFRDLNLENLR